MSSKHPWWRTIANQLRMLESREFVLLASVGALTACLWLFIAVTNEVRENEPHGAEKRIMLALRSPDNPSQPIGHAWIKPASIDITALGSVSVLTLITVLATGFLLLERKFRAAGFIVGAILGGTVLNQLLKICFNRDRPEVVPHLAEFSNSSYPSGHSMLSAIVYLTLASVAAQTLSNRWARVYLISAALLLAFLVGLSRVIVGVHYPTDVLAGWIAGTAWALLCGTGASWLKHRGNLDKTAFTPKPKPKPTS